MNILVTGASGFIGQRLIHRLSNKGHVLTGSGLSQRETKAQSYTYVSADLTRRQPCMELVRGMEAVVHCAGKAGAWGPREEYMLANVTATENMLEACRAAGVRRFIHLSSPSIYFAYKNQLNLQENDRPQVFSNAYAESKFIADQKVFAANSPQLSTLSLRPRGVVGAGDRNWLPRIIEMRQAGKLIQPGYGQNVVDFTSVENLLDAIELALVTANENCGRAYNVTDGAPEKLWDFITFALEHVGLDGQRKSVPVGLAMFVARMTERYHRLRQTKEEPGLLPIKVGIAAYSMTLDIAAAKTRLGYAPKVTSHEAALEFAEWWKKR